MPDRLTWRQRLALDWLLVGERHAEALWKRLNLTGEVDRWGVVCAGMSGLYDSQAWIHWRTANALQARGLVEIDGRGEDARVRLTPEGRDIVSDG